MSWLSLAERNKVAHFRMAYIRQRFMEIYRFKHRKIPVSVTLKSGMYWALIDSIGPFREK